MQVSEFQLEQVVARANDAHLDRVIDILADDSRPLPAIQAERQRRAATPPSAMIAMGIAADAARERIIAGNDLTDVNYLRRGMLAADSIGRVAIRAFNGRVVGYGTGFLIAPGIMMTNQHVLDTVDAVEGSSIQFGYETDLQGRELQPVEFRLLTDPAPIINTELDIAIAGVDTRPVGGNVALDRFRWLRLDSTPGKGVIGEYLTIIQHPGGARKQVCVRENKLLRYDANGPFVWYQTDTLGGSSGSPVFNNDWDVVAIHHSGVPRTKVIDDKTVWLNRDGEPWNASQGDAAIDWFANEGIRISRIVAFLRATHSSHPLATRVINATPPPSPDEAAGVGESGPYTSVGTTMSNSSREVTFTIPVRLTVSVDDMSPLGGPQSTVAASTPAASHSQPTSVAVEAVHIDQTNYNKRNGYQPGFLGEGFEVALPVVTAAAKKSFGTFVGGRLDYWNYTVAMNGDRRLAYYAASNIDATKFLGKRADGDTWFRDPRLGTAGDAKQIGQEWYGSQRAFEADRSDNPFDRGHLCSRGHLQWGDDLDTAKRNGDDSFHFTNCAPQHWAFNQNRNTNGLWFAVEDEVLLQHGNTQLCVINGPVFDAPTSTLGANGLWELDPAGKRSPDPLFGGVAVPKQFFKIIVWKQDDRLRCVGFVVTQENMLATVTRLEWPGRVESTVEGTGLTDGEARLYQVPISTIEGLTGLRFPRLTSAAETHESTRSSTLIDNATQLGEAVLHSPVPR